MMIPPHGVWTGLLLHIALSVLRKNAIIELLDSSLLTRVILLAVRQSPLLLRYPSPPSYLWYKTGFRQFYADKMLLHISLGLTKPTESYPLPRAVAIRLVRSLIMTSRQIDVYAGELAEDNTDQACYDISRF